MTNGIWMFVQRTCGTQSTCVPCNVIGKYDRSHARLARTALPHQQHLDEKQTTNSTKLNPIPNPNHHKWMGIANDIEWVFTFFFMFIFSVRCCLTQWNVDSKNNNNNYTYINQQMLKTIFRGSYCAAYRQFLIRLFFFALALLCYLHSILVFFLFSWTSFDREAVVICCVNTHDRHESRMTNWLNVLFPWPIHNMRAATQHFTNVRDCKIISRRFDWLVCSHDATCVCVCIQFKCMLFSRCAHVALSTACSFQIMYYYFINVRPSAWPNR